MSMSRSSSAGPFRPGESQRLLLDFPIHDGFFPQIVLSSEEVKAYKRLGKERLQQIARIAEDSDCTYKWSETRTRSGGQCLKARFLDYRESSNNTCPSVLLKSSVYVEARAEEIIQAIAKVKTKEYRKMMSSKHGNMFVDGRTLFRFPSTVAANKPIYAYRAIKWCTLRGKRRDSEHKSLDFCFLEYAGRKKAKPGSNVVGFCIQESIAREREVPTLQNFGIARGHFSRSGIILLKTHDDNLVLVTSICQVDGDLTPMLRTASEEMMMEMVSSVSQVKMLVERQRVSSLRFLEHWQWIPNAERKACAVCLRGFYFHRKHHCRACGEVVCSSCAPLRDLEEPIFDITQLRVCSSCMINAAKMFERSVAEASFAMSMLTSNSDSESYVNALRSPTARSLENKTPQGPSGTTNRKGFSPPPREEVLPYVRGRGGSPIKPNNERLEVISDVVGRIRQVRETINLTISDDDQNRLSIGDEDSYQVLYEHMDYVRGAISHTHDDRSGFGYKGRAIERGYDADNDDGSMKDQEITFDSVVRSALAAAQATREAGEAVLSSCASEANLDHLDWVDNNQFSPSRGSMKTAYTSSSSQSCPFSTSNYERIMAAAAASAAASAISPDDQTMKLDESLHFAEASNGPPSHKTQEIQRLESKVDELTRSLELALQKLQSFENRTSAVDNGPTLAAVPEIEPDEAKIGHQPPSVASPTRMLPPEINTAPETEVHHVGTQNEKRSRPLSTSDLVSELLGVMNSSELSKPPIKSRPSSRKSIKASSPNKIQEAVAKPTSGFDSSKLTSSMYVDEKGCLTASQTSSQESNRRLANGSASSAEPEKNDNGFDSTASSSASVMDGVTDIDSHTSSRGIFGMTGSGQSSGLDSSKYSRMMANLCIPDDDLSSSEDEYAHHNKMENNAIAFCDLKPRDSITDITQPRLGAARAIGIRAPSFPTRRSSIAPEIPYEAFKECTGVDESDELRELMDGLCRPRSASAPYYQEDATEDASGQRPSTERQPSTAWSDEPFGVRHMAPHRIEETALEVRSCLVTLRRQCPSTWERRRKLKSVYKVLGSLYAEGARSKYRTLRHEDIRYERALEETPVVIRLLKMAGFVSLPQKLTMRKVNQEHIGVFLNEIRRELKEYL